MKIHSIGSNIKSGRLIIKIPMSRDYIDEHHNLFRLIVCSDGVAWMYIGGVMFKNDIDDCRVTF